MTPGRSQNRTSTNLTSSSLMYLRTSSALLNIQPPRTGSGQEWPRDEAPSTRPGSIRDARRAGFPGGVSVVSAVLPETFPRDVQRTIGASTRVLVSAGAPGAGGGPTAPRKIACRGG